MLIHVLLLVQGLLLSLHALYALLEATLSRQVGTQTDSTHTLCNSCLVLLQGGPWQLITLHGRQ